jgi:hypothetical protein
MNAENSENNLNQQRQILSDLQHLLEKQIDLAHQGDITGVEYMAEQANSLVEEVTQMHILGCAQFQNQRTRLQELYESLTLAIAAHKKVVAENLSHLRKGRKTIKAYRSNT